MNPELKKNLTSSHYWFRALYVFIFVCISGFAAALLLALCVIQVVFSLLTGGPNQRLVAFSGSLASYLFAICRFACFTSEQKPFPFSDWPEQEPAEASSSQTEPSPATTPANTAEPQAAEPQEQSIQSDPAPKDEPQDEPNEIKGEPLDEPAEPKGDTKEPLPEVDDSLETLEETAKQAPENDQEQPKKDA